MFRPNKSEDVVICIPIKRADGTSYLSPAHKVSGWKLDAKPNELLIAEFILSDGTKPMSMNDFMKVAGKSNEDCDVYIKSVVVAKQECLVDVSEMLNANSDVFAGFCVEKIMEAHKASMFDEGMMLTQWGEIGCDQESIGSAVEIFTESNPSSNGE